MPVAYDVPHDPAPTAVSARLLREDSLNNRTWTEECQGTAHDERAWYFASNARHNQRIVRTDAQYNVTGTLELGFLHYSHLGDIDVHAGLLYGALEGPPGVFVARLDAFDGRSRVYVYPLVEADGSYGPKNGSVPWVAIDGSTGRLYTSSHEHAEVVRAYRIDHGLRRFFREPMLDCRLRGGALEKVQGGAITEQGELLLVSNQSRSIHVFRLADGAARGSIPIRVSTVKREELEGLDVGACWLCGAAGANVHVVLLDNDYSSRDDLIFKHYAVGRSAIP